MMSPELLKFGSFLLGSGNQSQGGAALLNPFHRQKVGPQPVQPAQGQAPQGAPLQSNDLMNMSPLSRQFMTAGK